MLTFDVQNGRQYSKIQFKCINISCKITSPNSELSNLRIIKFDNKASQILKICPLNFTLLQKN